VNKNTIKRKTDILTSMAGTIYLRRNATENVSLF
jgi:hypothetical protein